MGHCRQSALFFGALSAGSEIMESRAQVSHDLIYVIQAVTLLVLLAFQWVRWQRPTVETQEAEQNGPLAVAP